MDNSNFFIHIHNPCPQQPEYFTICRYGGLLTVVLPNFKETAFVSQEIGRHTFSILFYVRGQVVSPHIEIV